MMTLNSNIRLALKRGSLPNLLALGLFLFDVKALAQETAPTPPAIGTPATGATADPSSKSRRVTNFEWDPIAQAKSYEIEITPVGAEKKEPYRFTVNDPVWNGELKPGKYTMRLRSRDRRGVPGDWSSPEEFYVKLYAPKPLSPLAQVQIKSNETETYELTLQWEYQSEASKYKIHIEDETKRFMQDLESSEGQIKVKVPVARNYSWSITGFDKQGKEGEVFGGAIPFTVLGKKLETPKIDIPESPYVRELRWNAVPHTEKYKYSLLRKGNDRKWRKFKEEDVTETTLLFDPKWKGGEYKLNVSSSGTLREVSKQHSIVFRVVNGDRSVAAEQKASMRKAIERTVDWYFIASYLITQIQYSAVNVDQGSAPSTGAIGGTGRLGAGYLDENSPFGFLGIVDLSGFIIGQKNYTYPGLEAHGIFRWASGELGEIRISGGAYYKEIPEILGNAETGEFKVSQLGAFGLHGGGEYWYSLNSKLGLQVNGRVYFPVSGKTPNGKPLIASPSYQFGFLGSLRLNPKATGLMGYAFRKDEINYQASNATALAAGYSSNKTSVVGHYLNFFLEWDF